jgi:hypothetical protein
MRSGGEAVRCIHGVIWWQVFGWASDAGPCELGFHLHISSQGRDFESCRRRDATDIRMLKVPQLHSRTLENPTHAVARALSAT